MLSRNAGAHEHLGMMARNNHALPELFPHPAALSQEIQVHGAGQIITRGRNKQHERVWLSGPEENLLPVDAPGSSPRRCGAPVEIMLYYPDRDFSINNRGIVSAPAPNGGRDGARDFKFSKKDFTEPWLFLPLYIDRRSIDGYQRRRNG